MYSEGQHNHQKQTLKCFGDLLVPYFAKNILNCPIFAFALALVWSICSNLVPNPALLNMLKQTPSLFGTQHCRVAQCILEILFTHKPLLCARMQVDIYLV